MFARLGRLTHDRRRWVLTAAALFAVLAGVLGPAVSQAVSAGGFAAPGSESARAADAVEAAFGRGGRDVVVLWRHPDLAVDDPAFGSAVTGFVAGLPAAEIAEVVHPWTPGLPPEVRASLVGEDGRTAIAAITLTGADESARNAAYTAVEHELIAPEPWTTHLAGAQPVFGEMQERAESDLARAELLALPVLLALLVVIFGSVVAAALPVAVGVVAILGAMLLLRGLTLVTDVSPFALNVTTVLGLGLAIDYSLFMVSRFREELQATGDVAAAVERTVTTAGRTIAFSGLTVLIAFTGLLFFPQMFLRSMGLGGMAVVLLDMVLALTLLPALLAWLGHRIDGGRLRLTARPAGRRARGDGSGPGGWERLARAVLRRPVTVVVLATATLGVVALPALDIATGETDIRALPESSDARVASEVFEEQFPAASSTAVDVVITGAPTADALGALVTSAAAMPGAVGADVVGQGGGVTHLRVLTDAAPYEPAARDLVTALRELPAPAGTELLVGGETATGMDSDAAITDTLPGTLTFVALVTVVLLFSALGSIVLPIKAVVMNVASLGATVGMVVWAFGQGHLAGALGFTETGLVEASNLVLIGLVAFGLAMDYELFLLSRIREAHLAGADQATAIATGLQRSGRTITSAALLLIVVLVAMVSGSLTFLKLIGLGLAFAVALDATVVRALLVPATMRLLGRANWWLPRPLVRVHARIGFTEGGDTPQDSPVAASEAPLDEVRRREVVGAGV